MLSTLFSPASLGLRRKASPSGLTEDTLRRCSPGFHQLFFYGDYKRHLIEFCRLFNIEAEVV